MADTPTTPKPTVLDELARLTDVGVTTHSLERCQRLAAMIFDDELPVLTQMPTHRRDRIVKVIYNALSDVAATARRRAYEERERTGKPEKNPVFQTAAAAELLKLTDEAEFDLMQNYYYDADEWRDRIEGHEYRDPNSARMRQLRAGVWLGKQVDKTVRDHRVDLLEAFESAIKVYLADNVNLEERRALAIGNLEPPRPPDVLAPTYSRSPPVTTDDTLLHVRHEVDPKLRRAIRELTDVVRRQLQEEERWRKVSDPFALPIRWSNAPDHLADHWDNIRGDRGRDEPIPLAGTLDRVVDVFGSIPSGRLVVLGQGGAGKTVLAIELAIVLLTSERPLADEAIPVVFGLSSWDPTRKSLRGWMTERLIEDYPGLTAKAWRKGTLASRLVQSGYVLPIFDGFDEIAPELRPAAIVAFNASLNRDDKFVLTSRPKEYVDAIEKSDILTGAAVVELHDLTLDDLVAYLPKTTRKLPRGSANQTKWDHIFTRMRSAESSSNSTDILEVLITPLMASLARSIYSDTTADPVELLDAERFPDASTMSDYLLDQFIQVTYENSRLGGGAPRHRKWKPRGARRWLGFLAICVFAQDTRDFSWWKPSWLARTKLINAPLTALILLLLTVAACLELVAVFRGSIDTVKAWLMSGALACLMISIGILLGPSAEPRALQKPRFWLSGYGGSNPIREPFYFCFLMIFSMAFVLATAPAAIPKDGQPTPLLVTVVFVLILFIWIILLTNPPSLTETSSPQLLLRVDRTSAITRGAFYGISSSVICASLWIPSGHAQWLLMTPFLIAVVLLCTVLSSASGAWLVRRTGFAIIGWLPGRCMRFLEDAHSLGVLRQSGGIYQFRHALLQDRLAIGFLEKDIGRLKMHRTVLYARTSLTMSRFESGSLDSADRELRELLELNRSTKNHHGTATTWLLLIEVLRNKNRNDEALQEAQLLRKSIANTSMRQWRWYFHYRSRSLLAELLAEQGCLTEAVTEYSDLLSLLEELLHPNDPFVIETRQSLADLQGNLSAKR